MTDKTDDLSPEIQDALRTAASAAAIGDRKHHRAAERQLSAALEATKDDPGLGAKLDQWLAESGYEVEHTPSGAKRPTSWLATTSLAARTACKPPARTWAFPLKSEAPSMSLNGLKRCPTQRLLRCWPGTRLRLPVEMSLTSFLKRWALGSKTGPRFEALNPNDPKIPRERGTTNQGLHWPSPVDTGLLMLADPVFILGFASVDDESGELTGEAADNMEPFVEEETLYYPGWCTPKMKIWRNLVASSPGPPWARCLRNYGGN
jgi:hypothetical protein